MKKTLIVATMSIVSAVCLQAATTINPFNSAPGSFTAQVLLDGAPYTAGQVMVGTFTTTPDNGPIPADVWGWTMFGSAAFSSSPLAPGIFGAFAAPGVINGVTGTLPTTPTGPFVGNPIYAVVANPDSSEFLIWRSSLSFEQEDELLGGAAQSFRAEANDGLIRGRIVEGGNTGLGGPIAAFNGQNAVTFIPEPSVALLGAFGLLGLLRRRR